MGGGRRHALRRACLAASALCAVLAIGLPARAQDDGGPTPAVWHGAASAGVASVDVDRDALLPISGVLRFIALQGESVYETDNQTARTSVLFPGEGVIQGPNLACGTFGAAFPPQLKPVLDACTSFSYPLTVRADATSHDAQTLGALQLGKPTDAVSAEAVGARAHADTDAATTSAQIANVRLLGLPSINAIPLLPIKQLQLNPAVLAVKGATTSTDQRITDGKLVVQADSDVSGIDLVGGLIHIGAIHSSSKVTDGADGKRTADASLEVTGVTVGGLPAQITQDGLVLGSATGSLTPVKQALASSLTQLLKGLGVKVSLLDTVKTTDDGTGQAVASAQGLLIEIALNVQGAPTVPGPLGDIDLSGVYRGSIQLGYTGASGAASSFSDDADGTPPADAGTGAATDLGFVPDTGDGTTDLGLAPPDVGSTDGGTAAPAVTPPRDGGLVRSVRDPFDDRLGLVYAAFALAILGLCIAPRLALPARLPGSRS